MNEICKNRILDKFRELCDESNLKNTEIAEKLGIHVCNINWAKSKSVKSIDRITKPVLLKLRDIINSGESLENYFKKNGHPATKLIIEAKPEIEINNDTKNIDFIINISLRINGKEIKL